MSAAAIKALKALKYIKLGLQGMKSEDGKGRGILCGILAAALLILFAPLCALSLPGLIGKIENPSSFDLTQSAIYKEITGTYEKYNAQMEEKIKKRAEQLRTQNAYTVTVTDEEGNETEETRYPAVTVNKFLEEPLLSRVFAYIVVKHCDIQNMKAEGLDKWNYDEQEILEFLNEIAVYGEQIDKPSRESVILTVTTSVKSAEDIGEMKFGREGDIYVFSCSTFSEFDEQYGGEAASYVDGTMGWVSRLYETGSAEGNPGLISSGKGDRGGKSYGTCQYASNTGSLHSFLGWLMKYDMSLYQPMAGLVPASSAFDAAWKQVASQRRKDFGKAQNTYVYGSHAVPWIKNAYKSSGGIDFNRSYALQEMAYSRGVQHGGNGAMTVFRNAGISADATDAEIISKFYQYLHDNVHIYWSQCSPAVRAGVANRMLNEKKTLLGITGKDRPSEEGEEEEEKEENAS